MQVRFWSTCLFFVIGMKLYAQNISIAKQKNKYLIYAD